MRVNVVDPPDALQLSAGVTVTDTPEVGLTDDTVSVQVEAPWVVDVPPPPLRAVIDKLRTIAPQAAAHRRIAVLMESLD